MDLTLPLPLGKWHPYSNHQPGWFYQAQENALYHQTDKGVTCHSTYPQQSRAQTFHRQGELISDHPEWSSTQIAMVTEQGENIVLTGLGQTQEKQMPSNGGWLQQLENTTLGNTWNLKVWASSSMASIWQAIASHLAIVVLDGSFQNQCSACAWIIKGKNSADRIEGQMQTPGQPQDHSSFCSKAAGIYGALLMLWHFSQDYLPIDRTDHTHMRWEICTGLTEEQ